MLQIFGAEGLLGMIGLVDPGNSVRTKFMNLWGAASSKAACTPGGATAEKPFCDNDGDV